MIEKIIIGHSADADDAFMFHAIASQKIVVEDFAIEHLITDIESLNQQAFQCKNDVTAISFNAYSKVADKYDLLPCGASFGIKYGPLVVSNENISLDKLCGEKIAVPGINTSAFLLLTHYLGSFSFGIESFDKIIPLVEKNVYKAGLIIHEGQLTYKQFNLYEIIDLGKLWFGETNLPLPLGGLAIKKSLSMNHKRKIYELIKKSIAYGLENFDEAFNYAYKFSRNAPKETVREFIKMYVNELALDYSEEGRKALQIFSAKLNLPCDLARCILSI